MYQVKQSIQDFVRYKPNNSPYDIKLDANESRNNERLLLKQLSLENMNRYPDSYTTTLRENIATIYNIQSDEVLVGSGSSELLELTIKTFMNPGEIVLSIEPSFVMYKKYTQIFGGIYQTVPIDEKFQVDIDLFIEKVKAYQPKVLFLCTPNNPTGQVLLQKDVCRIIENTSALVVVDEAYMEFCETNETVIPYIHTYPNLIVSRTFSKAYALAGARLGYFIANKDLISTLQLAKTPYSVSTLSQQLGILALSDKTYLKRNVQEVIQHREQLQKALQQLGITIVPTHTNFIFCEYKQIDLKKELEKRQILIRGFSNGLYRITVGTEEENQKLINALETIL